MQYTFCGLSIDIDQVQTRLLYATLSPPDPQCCIDCRTFLEATRKKKLPPDLISFMNSLGIRPDSPVEAWGAPDAGFLQVWWPFVGRAPAPDDASLVVKPSRDSELKIAMNYPCPEFRPTAGFEMPALEFTWNGPAVQQLKDEATRDWGETLRDGV